MSASPLPSPLPAPVARWRAALDNLSSHASPCRYLAPAKWAGIREAGIEFCDRLGAEAHRLGWTAPELFAVHPEHGTLRIDYCGVLMIADNRPLAVEATRCRSRRQNGAADLFRRSRTAWVPVQPRPDPRLGRSAGSAPEQALTAAELTSIALQARVFVNDLDSLCVGLALARTDPTALPLSALLGAHYAPDAGETVTLHLSGTDCWTGNEPKSHMATRKQPGVIKGRLSSVASALRADPSRN